MMKEENTALRDAFDAQITALKEDSTLQKLIAEYIIKASDGGKPVAIAFEKFEGDHPAVLLGFSCKGDPEINACIPPFL